jgi:tRNA threonylcarbamoyl adenosine modification protein YeaZ
MILFFHPSSLSSQNNTLSLLLIHTASNSPLVAFGDLQSEPIILSHGHDHAQSLPLLLEEILSNTPSNATISAVAVCIGTGSYTALRIGITAAKMIALSWSIPLIALQTSMIYAHHLSLSFPSQHLTIILETQRNTLRLETFAPANPFSPSPHLMLTPPEILSTLQSQDYIVSGDALHHFHDLPSSNPPPENIGKAALLAALSLPQSHRAFIKDTHAIDALAPVYFGDTPS